MSVAALPSGPNASGLLGDMPAFRRDPLNYMRFCADTYGDIVPLRFGPRRAFLLSHPDQIEDVLVTQYRKFTKGPALRRSTPLFGNGLLTSEGDFWRKQRKLAQPAFHRERIAAYAQIMVDEAQARIRAWQDGATLDIHQEMMHLTMPIALKTLFGSELEAPHRVADALELAQSNFARWIHYISMLPAWVPTPRIPGLARAIGELDAIVYKLIAQRRASGEDRGDLLSMLLQARDEDGAAMSDKQLRDEVLTLFLAGHDTTALTLTWALYLLAQHPESLAALRSELQTVLQDRVPTVSDKPDLKYTEQVIQEAMRLYPPAWTVGRSAIETCEVGGQAIGVGDTVILSQWVAHHDPRWFADPDAFKPERWNGEFARALPRYAYFPFGGGPRVCIGSTFALMETVLILAVILQKWQPELCAGQSVILQPAVTLRPKSGIQMTLHKL